MEKIANILGVSRSTLHRRLREEGMQDDLWFSDICDDDLDILVNQIKEEHCNDGEVLMAGHLAARNSRVQRTRLRASIHRVDQQAPAELEIVRIQLLRHPMHSKLSSSVGSSTA